jgi:acetamidase/formamidase
MEEKYFVPKEQHAFALDPHISPVLEVTPPCTVTFETGDMPYDRLVAAEKELSFSAYVESLIYADSLCDEST